MTIQMFLLLSDPCWGVEDNMGHTHTCRQQQALLTAEAACDTQVYYRTSL